MQSPPISHHNWEAMITKHLGDSCCARVACNYEPQHSPHDLIQERTWRNPWALLVTSVFLNKTPGKSARSILYRFLEKYPILELCMDGEEGNIAKLLYPLGMQNRRAMRLVKLAKCLIERCNNLQEDGRLDVKGLPGIGQYGRDSWDLFRGDRDDAWMREGIIDKKLTLYVQYRRSQMGFV